jgi:hypothetical protein
MLGPEQIGDGWSTRKSFPNTHEWGQSAQKRLVLVCGASLEILESWQAQPRGGRGVTFGIETTPTVTRACADQVHNHVARSGTCADTVRIDVSKKESSWPEVDRRGRRSSKAGWVWYSSPGLNKILISISCNFFPRNYGLSVFGLEQSGDGWLTEKFFPDAHE